MSLGDIVSAASPAVLLLALLARAELPDTLRATLNASSFAVRKSILPSSLPLLTSVAIASILAKVAALPASSSPLKIIRPNTSLSAGLAEFL